MISQREIGYLEGILDGEGCITFGKQKGKNFKRGFTWRVRVRINMTHKKTIEKCAEIIRAITGLNDGSIGAINPQPDIRHKNHKTTYAFSIRSKASRLLLPKLKLVTKEEQRTLAIKALTLLKENTSWHGKNDVQLEEIYQRMKFLNHKGK